MAHQIETCYKKHCSLQWGAHLSLVIMTSLLLLTQSAFMLQGEWP